MLLKCPYVHEHKAGHCMVGQAAKRKEWFFFLFWLEEVLFHCVEHSNEIEFKKDSKWEEKKQQQQKTEISINEEPKLRIESQITVIIIIIALDKSKTRLWTFWHI